MTKFKTMEEFENFKDTAMFCVCGKLLTGFHMGNCRKLQKIERQIRLNKEKEAKPWPLIIAFAKE